MIENVLIIDTETTGLSPEKGAKVIEVAAVLFNIKHRSVLQCFSTLLPCDENPVEKINHIKAGATRCDYPFMSNKPTQEQFENIFDDPGMAATIFLDERLSLDTILIEMANAAQVCVAHNAQFDKKFIAMLSCGQALLSKQWICTKSNFTWPYPLCRLRLEDICYSMNVPYVNAHRALVDCLLLTQCFEKIDDLQERFDRCAI